MNVSALIAPDVSRALASRGSPGPRRVRRDISSTLYPAASRGSVRRPSAPRLSSCRSSFAGNAMHSLAARVVADSSRGRRLTVRADAGEMYGDVVRAAAPRAQQTFERPMRFCGKSADADPSASSPRRAFTTSTTSSSATSPSARSRRPSGRSPGTTARA